MNERNLARDSGDTVRDRLELPDLHVVAIPDPRGSGVVIRAGILDSLEGRPGDGGPQEEGARGRAVESVLAGVRVRGRTDQSRVRTTVRDHGTRGTRNSGRRYP